MTTALTDTEGYLAHTSIDAALLTRWSASIQPIPLPSHLTPAGGVPLRNTPNDALLKVSPHMIAHVQRTSSQGGLQVISPRQVPFTKTMLRHVGGKRMIGDHVVGSVAEPEDAWPTIDNDDLAWLLPDEPLPPTGYDRSLQPKTKTTPLTRASKLLADPVVSCLVKGRAVVDILRRDDVAGDGDGLLRLLADAWGVPVSVLSELEAYTLGVEGSLLRHAIKVDDVYPMMYAPVHIKRSIAMGASEVTRSLLPEDTAMDWKRARVFCEAVFAMAMSIEGHVMTSIRAIPHPGDPSTPTNRGDVLAFLPAPGSAWSYHPHTFSICPIDLGTTRRARAIPGEVLAALSDYLDDVRPISHALAAGHRHSAKRSMAVAAPPPLEETIAEGYTVLVKTISVGGGRGQTAAATIRNIIYDTLETLPDGIRLRIARFLCTAREVCRIHLGLADVPDSMIGRLAGRYTSLGDKVRMAVVAEAARRGASAEDWWYDLTAQAPIRYRHLAEGSHGWTRVALWLAFKRPTDRWDKLLSALTVSAMTRAASGAVGAVALPAKKGSMERLLRAAQVTVKHITTTFASYYMGIADVALAASDEAAERKLMRTKVVLEEGAYLWTLRARSFRGTNVNPMAHDEPSKSFNHYRVEAEPVDLVLAPAPYRAYEAYMKHLEQVSLVSTEVKRLLAEDVGPVVSEHFKRVTRPILKCERSIATKYLLNPPELASDMEKSWMLLVEDLRRIADQFTAEANEVAIEQSAAKKAKIAEFKPREFVMPKVDLHDYYSTLARLEQDSVMWVESVMEELPEDTQDLIENRRYENTSELVALLLKYEAGLEETGETTTESVH